MAMSRERIKQIIFISLAVVVFLTILIFTIDYVAFRDSRIKNRLAKTFCDCVAEENASYKELETCYGEHFKRYNRRMSTKEQEVFIEAVRERVFKSCPEKTELYFNQLFLVEE